MPRLNKFIASTGLCSRRKADELIIEGKVAVNGKIITELGFYVREKDKVSVDGKTVRPQNLEYYRFYKPAGYITTHDDEKYAKEKVDNHENDALISKVSADDMLTAMDSSANHYKNLLALNQRLTIICYGVVAKNAIYKPIENETA